MPDEQRNVPSVMDVTIGALLHDIGKFMQRAATSPMPNHIYERANDVLPVRNGRYSHWHALWTDTFFDWIETTGHTFPKGLDHRNIRDMAVYHHKPLQAYPDAQWRAMTWLVTIADRLASGYERRPKDETAEQTETGRDAFRRTPLSAIMAVLKLDKPTSNGVLLPTLLASDSILPQLNSDGNQVSESYTRLWRAFCQGWANLVMRAHNDPEGFEQGLLCLLEHTTWAVPSSTMDQPDIPLFDHSRAVAAFAAALYNHHEHSGDLMDETAIRDVDRPRFRLVNGDLSGLQKTLFRFASEGVKGQNKILRGRSFRFQLIADAAARRVLKAFGMPFSAALQMAGGRFLLLLPELGTNEMNSRVDCLQAELDDWLAEQYCGDLGVGLALSEPFSVHDLVSHGEDDTTEKATMRANQVRDKIRLLTETAKLRQMQGPLARAVIDYDYSNGPCRACGLRPARVSEKREISEDPIHCAACSNELHLGHRLPKADYVSIRPSVDSGSDATNSIFGLDYRMPHGEWSSDQGWRIGDSTEGPAARRLAEAYVPLIKQPYCNLDEPGEVGDIKTFQMLAHDASEEGTGRKMLAVVKADVDHLGMLFSEGLGARWSLARSATLSRMVDAYFSIRLPDLLKNHFPNVYTVYAGGDDLMLVAPWRDGFAFAEKLACDFARFSLNNPNVTLSAGIALFDARSPLTLAAHEAEERLEDAKSKGRNKVSAISGPMGWEKYKQSLLVAKNLNDAIRSGRLPTALAYRLLALEGARRRVEQGQAFNRDYAWRARLGYQLARIGKQAELMQLILSLFGLNQTLQLAGEQDIDARFALTHAIYRNR